MRKSLPGCRGRFQKYLNDPQSLSPDLAPVGVRGRRAIRRRNNLEPAARLGLKTTSIEEKQNYYNALADATDPKLIKKTLPISLTDELPTSRAVFLVSQIARLSEHPEMAWKFAKTNIKTLLAKTDALGGNSYVPGLFTFFSEPVRITELRAYAKDHLPGSSAREVAKAVDEIEFRAEFKARMARQLISWIDKH